MCSFSPLETVSLSPLTYEDVSLDDLSLSLDMDPLEDELLGPSFEVSPSL